MNLLSVILDLYASVEVSIVSVSSTDVNITIEGAEGSADISDIETSCSTSDPKFDCSSLHPIVNQIASGSGWVKYSGLYPGTSYQITAVRATYGGKTDVLLFSSITFCTGKFFKIFLGYKHVAGTVKAKVDLF